MSTALTALRTGDMITHITAHGELVALDYPALVLAPFGEIEPGVYGVQLHSAGPVEHVLYPATVTAATVTNSSRGYASRDAATRAARAIIGWSTKGGCYYRPLPGAVAQYGYQTWTYTGIRGIDRAGERFTRDRYLVQVGTRWFVTELAHIAAATWAARDAKLTAAERAGRCAFCHADVLKRDVLDLCPSSTDEISRPHVLVGEQATAAQIGA